MEKLENIDVISFITLISINNMILFTTQALIRTSSSASLITSCILSILAIIISLILCFLAKNFQDRNFLHVSEFLGGKFFKFIIGILFVAYFTFRTSLSLKKISDCLQIIYYPMTNVLFIALLFCIATGISLFLDNNSIFKTASFILPILFATSILIFIGNSKNFNYENIFPVLGNGIKTTFIDGLSNIYVFQGLAYVIFLPDKLKKPKDLVKTTIISIVISSIFLIFSCGNILFLFNENFTNSEFLPLYVSVRCIEFGTFFQRLDSMFLLLCILGFAPIFCLNVYIVVDIIKNITNISNDKPLVFPYLLVIFGLTMCYKLNSTILFLENSLSKILFLVFGIIIPFLILSLANIKRKIIGGMK